jgi:RNA polymerase sigma-70 factor (ECF subfamily)
MNLLESSLNLLQRAQAGDRDALDQLLERYRPRLVRWASGRLPRYARDLTETQDLVQDTLLQALRHIEAFDIRGEGALQAYLRQAILNRVRMELRRVGRKPPAEQIPDDTEAQMQSPLEAAVGAEALERYERALATLSEDDRQLIIARLEYGYSHQEIASMLGRPNANACRVALQRVLLRLVEEMSRDDRQKA